jgi:hypothetical protein
MGKACAANPLKTCASVSYIARVLHIFSTHFMEKAVAGYTEDSIKGKRELFGDLLCVIAVGGVCVLDINACVKKHRRTASQVTSSSQRAARRMGSIFRVNVRRARPWPPAGLTSTRSFRRRFTPAWGK